MNTTARLLAIVVWFVVQIANGQEPADSPVSDATNNLSEIDEMFGDIKLRGIAGAVCTVVKDGRVIHSKGYGVENRTTLRPVDPQRTRFYLASVTKSLTATAIVRLLDKGALNLDEDISTYLGGEPRLEILPGSSPITLRNLLTHTAGFDDRNIGMATDNADQLVSLSAYLSRALPPQVRPAGEITMYDNHGWALAGLIAERVTKKQYPRVLEQELFGPLGMKNSVLINSEPNGNLVDLAEAYVTRYQQGQIVWKKVKRWYRLTSPAGSVWSTAADMSRFIRMHLDNGQIDGAQFISENALMEMQTNSWVSQPGADGLTAGFWERHIKANRVLMIMGAAPEGASIIAMIPSQKLGVFMAVSRGDLTFLTPILEKVLDQLAPGTQTSIAAKVLPGWNERSSKLAGEYFLLRFSQHSLEAFAKWQAWVRVDLDGSGKIRTTDSLGGVRVYNEVSENVYRQDGKPGFISFKSSPDGKVIWATTTDGLGSGDGMGFPNSFQKAKWFECVTVKQGVLLGSILVFGLAIFVWPLVKLVARIVRLFRRNTNVVETEGETIQPRFGRTLVYLMAACGLSGILGVALLLTDPDQLVIGMPAWGQIPCWLLLIFAALSFICFLLSIVAWKQNSWSLIERLFVSTVAVTAIILVPFLWQWNLINWSY